MAKNVKIKKHAPYSFRSYNSQYRTSRLTYRILDGLYQRTILNPIIQTLVSNIVPPFYTLTVEGLDGQRMENLELECRAMSQVINRTFLSDAERAFFLYGTALAYVGAVDLDNFEGELFLLHPADVLPVYYEVDSPKYGEIKHWVYRFGNKTFEIPAEHIKVYANDPDIGSLFGNSMVNYMQDTLIQFLNNRTDLAEILNRYAIPIVQWAVDVTDVSAQDQDSFITRIRKTLHEQFAAGDDIISDARVEPRVLGFASDVGHLISILDASRKDLGMLGVPESLMGGQISNLSGGKTQAAVFMTKVNKYRAILNDFLAEVFYIPYLKEKGYIRGKDYHNVYIAFPRATTELPSEKIIEIKTSVEMGFITLNEARMELGYRGAAPGVTDELKEIFKVRSIQYETANGNGNQTDPSSQKTKVDEPKKRDGSDPDKEKDSTAKSQNHDRK